MGKYDHQFHERDDDLSHCNVCGGAEGSLPTLCPGRKMTQEEEAAVYAAELDFNTGPMVGAQWWTKLSPATQAPAANWCKGCTPDNCMGCHIPSNDTEAALIEEHARGEVWRWQADGADHLESMGNRMGVLIYASDLRDLIKASPSVDVINALMAADEALKDSADTLRRLQDSSMAGQIESARMLITAALPLATPGFTVSKEGWGTGWELGKVTVIELDEPAQEVSTALKVAWYRLNKWWTNWASTQPQNDEIERAEFDEWQAVRKAMGPDPLPTPLDALLAYEAPPLTSDYDGFICELAAQHGAMLLNDGGSVYAFTQEQLIAFTKANRAPARSQGVITHIPMADGVELEFEPYVISSSVKLWALKRDGARVRYLNQFEHGFVDAAIHATRLQTDRPAIDQLVKSFRAIGDQMYCDYINQMRRDVCLGWESKVHSRKFTAAELEGHTKAAEFLGRHRAFHDAASALAQLGSQPVPAETGSADAATVQVPKKFIQEFMTLAHNYSLYAEAPDFYFGTERDAFQNAYRRCGGDLAKVKDLLTKSEGEKL